MPNFSGSYLGKLESQTTIAAPAEHQLSLSVASATQKANWNGAKLTVWGTADALLPWPRAAARWQAELPHADWIELEGVGHAPQLDVPLETAELILGFP